MNRKLMGAKEKLKQLQDLISRLTLISSANEKVEENPLAQSSKKIHELQQKEANKALDYLNELERQKKQDKLDELKRNKQKLLELLHEKENEAKKLEQLQITMIQDDMTITKTSSMRSPLPILNNSLRATNNNTDLDIENNFRRAENDFDVLLSVEGGNNSYGSNVKSTTTGANIDFAHSPSDLLWKQMKKQLNMRENLRNKKKELEDLIRDEYKQTATGNQDDDEKENGDTTKEIEEVEVYLNKKKNFFSTTTVNLLVDLV